MRPKNDSYHAVLQKGIQSLAKCGIADADTDAWLLLEFVTGMNRTRFLMNRMDSMPEDQQQYYRKLLSKRESHIPLQHLTGVQEFMGFPFRVNEHVLIPRQDTEILTEQTLALLQPAMKVLDLCTGSGCIGISLKKLFSGDIQMTCSDLSEEALNTAEENAQNLQAEIRFVQSDLFANLPDRYDMIVSNPPYIPTAAIKELSEEVRLHDPFGALDGKEDGLYFYRRIIDEVRMHLTDRGWIAFEIGFDQGLQVSAMLQKAGFIHIRTVKDLAGLDRVVLGQQPGCRECKEEIHV